MTHINASVNKAIIGSDNGLSPVRHHYLNQCRIIVNWNPEANFNKIQIKIWNFKFNDIHMKMPSANWRSFRTGLNVLTHCSLVTPYGDLELMAPSHYLTQCWRIIRKVHVIWWHYHKKIWRYQSVQQDWELHFYNRIQIPRGQWVKSNDFWTPATTAKPCFQLIDTSHYIKH